MFNWIKWETNAAKHKAKLLQQRANNGLAEGAKCFMQTTMQIVKCGQQADDLVTTKLH